MSDAQQKKITELADQGWITHPVVVGGPIVVKDPQGKLWLLASDGSLSPFPVSPPTTVTP
jgi:hypothetical protein